MSLTRETQPGERRHRGQPVPADCQEGPKQKTCSTWGCGNTMSGKDGHAECMYCLGLTHTRESMEEIGPVCLHCEKMDDDVLNNRLGRVQRYYDNFAAHGLRERSPTPPPRRARIQVPPKGLWPRVTTGEGQRATPRQRLDYSGNRAPTGASSSRAAPAGASRDRYATSASATRAHEATDYEAHGARPRDTFAPRRSSPAPRARQHVVQATIECPPRHTARRRQPAVAPSYMVDRLDPSPDRAMSPGGEHWTTREEGELRDDELPSFQEQLQDYHVLDEAYADERDGHDDLSPGDYVSTTRRPFDDLDAMDIQEHQQARAPVPPPPVPPMDDSNIYEIYRKASARCNHTWPKSTVKVLPWEGRTDESAPPPAPRRQKLPMAQGFEEAMMHAWDEPLLKVDFPKASAKGPNDIPDKQTLAIDFMPAMDKAIAAYLANPAAPRVDHHVKEPQLLSSSVREASKLNKWQYAHMSFVAKALNAGALLQGSMKSLLIEMGQKSIKVQLAELPEDLAELRRLNHEMATLQRDSTLHNAKAMACSILQERWRWVDQTSAISLETKKEFVAGNIHPDSMFKDALAKMSETIQQLESSTKTMKALEPLANQAAPVGRPKAKKAPWKAKTDDKPRSQDRSGDRQRQPAGRGRADRRTSPPPYKARSAPRGRGQGKRK